ncbi:MAG: DUF4920 domain-containing protein [Flavobacteriales bacterium]|nr:DUF4920 domain-containing protein [Flavobacteriales bacterium]|tara:strand:+ start:12208 stop:12687 length:480 start_codon:yes stop_codon:yes gene_type:complete
MKKTLFIIGLGAFVACSNPSGENKETSTIVENFYGEKIDNTNITDYSSVKKEVENNGTSTTKIQGEILSTCAKKGCWMELNVGDDTLMVRFKDYGFFVPKEGVEGKTAIINGEAFFDTLSVELLQHYAEDAGKSSEEILSINEPEYVVAFTADGVIIQD